MHLVIGVLAAVFAYWMWPTGVTDIPFAGLTLGVTGSAFLSILAWITAAIHILFSFEA